MALGKEGLGTKLERNERGRESCLRQLRGELKSEQAPLSRAKDPKMESGVERTLRPCGLT